MHYQVIDTGNSRLSRARTRCWKRPRQARRRRHHRRQRRRGVADARQRASAQAAVLIELGNEMPRRAHGRGARRRRLERARLRALPARRSAEPRTSWSSCGSRAPAEAAIAAAKEIFEAAGLKVAVCGDFDGPHPRPPRAAVLQRGAAAARRRSCDRRRHRHDAEARPRLSGRSDLAARAHRARAPLRRHAGALRSATAIRPTRPRAGRGWRRDVHEQADR